MDHSGKNQLLTEPRGSLRVLVLGASGAGMSAAIDILNDLQHTVVGFDDAFLATADSHCRNSAEVQSPRRLTAERFPPDITFLNAAPDVETAATFDLCIASPAFGKQHPALQSVVAARLPVFSLPQFVAEVFRHKKQICVAGTHGKSTTAAMLAWILEQCGQPVSYFVGAQRQGPDGRSGRWSSSGWAVIESCEYAKSFLNYRPDIAVLTGIERDHFDCFADTDAEDHAYQSFVDLCPPTGTLIGWQHDERSNRIFRSARAQTCVQLPAVDQQPTTSHVTPAIAEPRPQPSDWTISDVRVTRTGVRATIRMRSREGRIHVPLPGRHNLQNAVLAIAAAHAAGVDLQSACDAVSQFAGLRRRFEHRGTYRGLSLVDDYAHHPTAIRHTMQATAAAFPGQRIVAVMEPHQLCRLRSLFDGFVEALIPADEILVLPVFAAREDATLLECCRVSGDLVRSINQRGGRAFLFANLDQIVARIDHSARPNDVLLTLGAGRTNLIHDEFHRRLQRHSVA